MEREDDPTHDAAPPLRPEAEAARMIDAPAVAAVPMPKPRARSRPRDRAIDPFDLAPPLHELGLIGNLHTAALVSTFGSIDWACFPRFASPSLFGRLLDLHAGGTHRISPVDAGRGTQRYRPGTAILETTFVLEGARHLTVTDFMPVLPPPVGERAPMIVRVVEAFGGPVLVRATMDPRLEYGVRRPEWAEAGPAWIGRSEGDQLGYVPGWPARATDEGLAGVATLSEGQRATFEIFWGAERPTATPALELLPQTERFWTAWVHAPTSPIHLLAGRWHPWVERTEITLKLLSHADTGAFVAAPTTSLPEWPGGHRNWDYRYVWIRDAAFAAQSLLLMGHVYEARSFLIWALAILRGVPAGEGLKVVYRAHPDADLTERELDHLAGYRNSKPVRIGNAASDQFQLDIYGELLDAALLLSDIDREALADDWADLERLAEEVVRLWRKPDQGIWEVRGPPLHYVHSKVMSWVALDRAVALGRRYGQSSKVARWEEEALWIQSLVMSRGYDPRRETFVQAFDRPSIDAANLRIPLVGFLSPDDPRIAGTILRIESELCDGPFVYRYRADDGISDPEGAFLPCSFWLVECLARAGERRRARQNFERLLHAAGPLRLFSEEYDPRRATPLGNYPQAFTHIAMLRATLALGLSNVASSVLQTSPWLAHAVPHRRAADAARGGGRNRRPRPGAGPTPAPGAPPPP
jgi:GH15 family glucan-1,4-alpha-glucosidase